MIAQLVEKCRADPSRTSLCLQVAMRPKVPKATVIEEGEEPEAPFHATYAKLYRTPKEDIKLYLAATAPEIITEDILCKCEKAQDGSIRNAFYYSHHVLGSTAWPRFAHDKFVWRSTFKCRHAEVGSRLLEIVFVDFDGPKGERLKKIDWNSWGQFTLAPDDSDKKTEIVATCDGSKVALDDPITGPYQIVNNWSIGDAEIQYKNYRIPIYKLFLKKLAPKPNFFDPDRVSESLTRFATEGEQERLRKVNAKAAAAKDAETPRSGVASAASGDSGSLVSGGGGPMAALGASPAAAPATAPAADASAAPGAVAKSQGAPPPPPPPATKRARHIQ